MFDKFINSFINYSKLYLIGDLDDKLISDLSKMVKNKFKLIKANATINNNIKKSEYENYYNRNNLINIFNSKMNFIDRHNFLDKNYLKVNKIINRLANVMSETITQDNTVINYIYQNNNTYEKESYTGLFYNIKMLNSVYYLHLNLFVFSVYEKVFTELRSKKGLGYNVLLNSVTSFSNNTYLYFYVRGPMKTPIEVQDEIQSVIKEILYDWNVEDFNEIKKTYIEFNLYLLNAETYSKRVNMFIQDDNINNKKVIEQEIGPANFREAVEAIKNIFENPIRIGIFEYANYIDSKYINEEIKKREKETYFLNNKTIVSYKNINTLEINN